MAVRDELKIHNSIYAFIIIILPQQVPLVALCVYLPCRELCLTEEICTDFNDFNGGKCVENVTNLHEHTS